MTAYLSVVFKTIWITEYTLNQKQSFRSSKQIMLQTSNYLAMRYHFNSIYKNQNHITL